MAFCTSGAWGCIEDVAVDVLAAIAVLIGQLHVSGEHVHGSHSCGGGGLRG